MGGNARAACAITSFAVNLLPFFKPGKDLHGAEFCGEGTYIDVVSKHPVFHAMAWYLDSIGYRVNSEFKPHFKEMVQKFVQSNDPIYFSADPYLEAIDSALTAWKPSGGNRSLKSKEATKAKDKVMDFMYITYAMEIDPEFKVVLSSSTTDVNRNNFMKSGPHFAKTSNRTPTAINGMNTHMTTTFIARPLQLRRTRYSFPNMLKVLRK
jgi:hypothetical protein